MENSSTVACLPHTATEPLFNQELHTLFHPHAWLNPSSREEKPSDTVPCSGFGFVNTSNCAGIGITQHFSTDVDSRSWIDKSSPHGLSKDPDPLFFLTDWKPLLSHGQIPKESCVQQAMAALASNESVNAAVSANASVEMAQILDNWGSFTQNVSLTANSAKGGLLINGDVHVSAPSMDPELGKRIAKLSCLSMQASSTPSSQLPQVVANPLWGHRGKLDPIPSQLNKAGSPDNLTSMPTSLYTLDQPICTSTTIANGCHTGLEGKVMPQTVMVSPSMHAMSQIKEEHVSMDMSDANFGQEASSVCDTSGGGETSTERVNKGKNKRVKDQPKVDAAQVVNVKNAGTMDESKEGKRRKCGGNTSEEDQKVDSGDSMPSSCKESSKHAEPSKLDYIHVRARRGQATDSHSLAERVRREKISKRMKFLQDLVPGCSKITGKALMLDEIINYVQSLQRQVEFLSMKLACISPMLDFQMDGHFGREIIRPHAMDHKALMMSEESTNSYSPYLHLPQPACTSQLIIRPSPLVNACSLGGSGTAGRQTMSTPFVSMDSYGDAVSQLTQFRGEELQHVLQGRRAPSTSSSLQGQALYNGKTEIGL